MMSFFASAYHLKLLAAGLGVLTVAALASRSWLIAGFCVLSVLAIASRARSEEYLIDVTERKHVVVVGGGFAGLAATRRLRKHFDVTLIDAKEFFEYAPGMLRPYVSPAEHMRLTLTYAELCHEMSVQWVWGRVTRLDAGKLLVHPAGTLAKGGSQKELQYDYCVVAAGCTYGLELDIPRRATSTAECLWYPTLFPPVSPGPVSPGRMSCFDWSSDVRGLAERCGYDERRLADRRAHIVKEHQTIAGLAAKGATVAVIGAGPVGVEFATELRYYFSELSIIIVETRESCCASFCKSARDYIQAYLDRKGISCFYGQTYAEMMAPNDESEFWKKLGVHKPDRCFMSVGLRPQNGFIPKKCLSSGRRGGWINTNSRLQVVSDQGEQGEALLYEGRVFAVGNCVGTIPGLDPLPKNVAPAEEMSVHAVKNIYRHARREELLQFCWPWLAGISATSLGPYDGVCVINNRLPGSGFVCLRGHLVAWQKALIQWSKIDECRLGWIGTLIWSVAH